MIVVGPPVWVTNLAGRFWVSAGGVPAGFPRDLELPAAFVGGLTCVRRAGLRLATVADECQPRRVHRDQFWRETITDRKASGQSVTAFCAARGLAEATFYVKRRAVERRNHDSTRVAPLAGPMFVAVRVIPDFTVEILVPGGVTLRVPVGADPAAVARLVIALMGEPC